MEVIEGQQRFGDADELFRAGRYDEALTHLEFLHRAYPYAKNVMYPLALCLEKLGRSDEALPLCAALVERFQDPRAMAMQQRLRPLDAGSLLDSLEIEGDFALPDLGPMKTVPVPIQEDERPSTKRIIAMGAVGAVGLFVVMCIPFFLQQLGILEETERRQAFESSVTLFSIGLVMIWLVLFQTLGTGVASLVLGVVKKLPANTISGVLLDVGVTLLGANLIAGLVTLALVVVAPITLGPTLFVVENVVMLVVFARVYKFSVGDSVVFLGFFLVYMCVAAIVAGFVFGTGLGLAALFLSVV